MKNPLLEFSLESLEFALELYMGDKESRMKFCLIHLDNSIELLLKAKLLEKKISIYDKHGRTIDFHKAILLLEENNVQIMEKAILEYIRDDRNMLQHKGMQISVEQVKYYLEETFGFMERFLRTEFRLELSESIPERHYSIMRTPNEVKLKQGTELKIKESKKKKSSKKRTENELEIKLDKINESLAKVYSSITLREIEKLILKISKKIHFKSNNLTAILEELNKKGKIDKKTLNQFYQIKTHRNKMVHSNYLPSKEELEKTENVRKKLQEKLKKIVSNLHSEELKKNTITIVGKGIPDTGSFTMPEVLTVKHNESILFKNKSNVAHTITSGKAESGGDGLFNSELLIKNSQFEISLEKQDKSGVTHYFCMVHPWEKGIIRET